MRTKLYKILVLILVSGLLNKLTISCVENNKALKKIEGKQLPISEELTEKESFKQDIAPYKKELESLVTEVLCFNPRTLSRQESPLESSLGNFYADVCIRRSDSIFFKETGQHIDFALFNYGGIRTAIPQGEVMVKHIFQLMPFENKLVVAELTGEKVQELINYLEQSRKAHPVSGIRLEMIKNSMKKVTIKGNAFDPNKNYYVLTHDYLQHGGDNMTFFKEPVTLFSTQYKVRDALIDELKGLDTLYVDLDQRFTNN